MSCVNYMLSWKNKLASKKCVVFMGLKKAAQVKNM